MVGQIKPYRTEKVTEADGKRAVTGLRQVKATSSMTVFKKKDGGFLRVSSTLGGYKLEHFLPSADGACSC